MLINLTLNALEATPEEGLVRLSAQREEDMVRLCVDDTGAGVPLELRSRVFEPFFTTKEEGSGLGLSIVHSVVSQHGGSLEVTSSPSGGARFLLRLPLVA
ncbi:sensor histidine kinase [Cystobacter fuscus]